MVSHLLFRTTVKRPQRVCALRAERVLEEFFLQVLLHTQIFLTHKSFFSFAACMCVIIPNFCIFRVTWKSQGEWQYHRRLATELQRSVTQTSCTDLQLEHCVLWYRALETDKVVPAFLLCFNWCSVIERGHLSLNRKLDSYLLLCFLHIRYATTLI